MHTPETPTKEIYWEFLKREGTQEQEKGKTKRETSGRKRRKETE